MKWQLIETAPKDNKRLLYLARFDEEGKLRELDFDGVWERWQESWELSHINGYAWFSENGIEDPTHWAYQDGPPPTEEEDLWYPDNSGEWIEISKDLVSPLISGGDIIEIMTDFDREEKSWISYPMESSYYTDWTRIVAYKIVGKE